MKCEKCGKEHDGSFGSGRFCSRACANSRTRPLETRMKTSDSIRRRISEIGYWGVAAGGCNRCYKKKLNQCNKSINECNKHESAFKIYTCRICGKQFTMDMNRDTKSRKFCSQDCLSEWRHTCTGGYREGSGRSKSGWYKGVFCGSTWELAFLIYHLDNNLNIKRCTEKREYVYKGKVHTYLPDFITDEGTIEIKGYNTKQWEAKHQANPDIIVLYKNDIKKYIDYVHNKYGNILEDLYDNSNPKLNNTKKKYVWIHKGDINTRITPNKLQEYLDKGYILGRYIKPT